MKKLLHGLSIILLVLLPLMFGGVIVYGSLFQRIDEILSPVRDSKLTGIMTGLILILIALLYLFTLGKRRPKVKFISFESDAGAVSISVNAVRDFIRKTGEEFSAVEHIDPKLRADKENIGIDLDVKIKAGSRIPELSQVLQTRVRESLRDGLGITDVSDIKVRVQEIVGDIPVPHGEEN